MLDAARGCGARTVGFCGSVGSTASTPCNLMMAAPSASTPQIHQVQIAAAHAIRGLVEFTMFRTGG